MTWRAISAWPDPSALFHALGADVVKQKADEGDRAAQFSLGYCLIGEVLCVDGAGLLGAASRTTQVEVGLARECTVLSLTRPSRVDGHLTTK